MPQSSENKSIQVAIAWCLAWGNEATPKVSREMLKGWRTQFEQGQMPNDPIWTGIFEQVTMLAQLTDENFQTASALATALENYPYLRSVPIGLVYGGVTKVKSYVFESADLQEIRGGSALLDRINLVDIPALFRAEKSVEHTGSSTEEHPENIYDLCKEAPSYCEYVRHQVFSVDADSVNLGADVASISEALIPELIVYSTGGNVLAFCPAAFVDQLCNTIEKRYTTETLTANSCVVGSTFRAAELYFGLLRESVAETLWHDEIVDKYKDNKALQAYFGFGDGAKREDIETAFKKRKNFGELVGRLTSYFDQRRSGDDSVICSDARPSRRYPPMFETHPYLVRDDSDIRSVVKEIDAAVLPNTPKLSEPTARKRYVGQLTKRDEFGKKWYTGKDGFKKLWNPVPERVGGIVLKSDITFKSWVARFEDFLRDQQLVDEYDRARNLFDSQNDIRDIHTREARSLTEIGASSNGYVGYIYADGNSMGRYIREEIGTPERYQTFSRDIFEATKDSVYCALADHIHPVYYQPDAKSSRQLNQKEKDPVWIHPFEIVTIGGDDVLLIVPANKAVEVAHSIGQHFERILLDKDQRYADMPLSAEQRQKVHRYLPQTASLTRCQLSTSSGVLITAVNTPFYYALDLVTQLQKSAKKYLKTLAKDGYKGGTVDFLVLKAVTMITSDITAFRKTGLTLESEKHNHILKLQAAPYTLHDLNGLIKTVRAIEAANFPKSQLYQIRSLLERGKRTAILNYRYFRARLASSNRQLMEDSFENAWCAAATNQGNLAPWLTPKKPSPAQDAGNEANDTKEKTIYETIWRELVELGPFIEEVSAQSSDEREADSLKIAAQATQEAS